tara:strand:+ start:3526 stop:4209 length:684 start_codon:yes stop_codon:yes gene_type:complete
MTRLLLVEDDKILQESIQECLRLEGFEVTVSGSLGEARKHLEYQPDLIILDWMLPDGQGIEILRDLQREEDRIPTIMLTARSDLIDKVLGLEMGADDYITKPFELRELVARIRVQLRNRSDSSASSDHQHDSSLLTVHGISMNLASMEVEYGNQIIQLTKMEYSLLKMFLESPGQVFSRDELLDQVWGLRYPTTRTVDMHVRQLRQKFNSELFETVHGTGYRFRAIK